MSFRAFRALTAARCRVLLQYRAAAAAGIVTQLFWGLVRVMIFEAFYRAAASPQPMSIGQVVSYVWLGQATFRILPWAPDADVRQQVRTGAVAIELLSTCTASGTGARSPPPRRRPCCARSRCSRSR